MWCRFPVPHASVRKIDVSSYNCWKIIAVVDSDFIERL
ncbi:MAG: hypothetical protein ACJAUZ_002139, partial [Flavobacteriaceae bacterium]